jgi:hypothetical protein
MPSLTPISRTALSASLVAVLAAGMVSFTGGVSEAITTAPVPQTFWVDPVRGNDTRTGATKALALRTLSEAWNRIPQSRNLTRPVRIFLAAGTISPEAAPNYWEHRWGTAAAPITILSADGPNLAQLPSMNLFDVRHLILDGVVVRSPFDPFHCERCSYVELRRSAFVGVGDPARDQGPQEGVKINQSDHLRITDSYLAGATDNALDMVAVQHAYIARNTIAHAVDWCAYAKGGSTDIEFDGNDVHHCGTGGITLGQGTGLQFMVAPWTNYESYGSRVVNNVLHDIDGAALGVNGGYASLLAYNTAYRTGRRDHLLEVVFGERSCDGTGEDDPVCTGIRNAGGWGPRHGGGDPAMIGDSQTAVVGNLLYNPDGYRSEWAQFGVYGPRPAGDSGGPATAVTDDRLVIRGNAIWNGPADLDLGLGGEQGCPDGHPSCDPAQVRAQNGINTVVPPVKLVAGIVPVPTGTVAAGSGAGLPLPTFRWDGVPVARGVPAVAMPTTIERDRAGRLRSASPWRPGAYTADAPSTSVRIMITGAGTVRTRTGALLRDHGGWLTVLRGDWIELSAVALPGHRLAQWGGACAGQRGPDCVLPASAEALLAGVTFQ